MLSGTVSCTGDVGRLLWRCDGCCQSAHNSQLSVLGAVRPASQGRAVLHPHHSSQVPDEHLKGWGQLWGRIKIRLQ